MLGILRNRPRVTVIFAALTLLIATLAVFSSSPGSTEARHISFTITNTHRWVTENTTMVGITRYSATPSDEARYYITGPDADDFYIDDDGYVFNARPFDYETPADRLLEFTVNGRVLWYIASANVRVQVSDKNDPSQFVAPEITCTVQENAPQGEILSCDREEFATDQEAIVLHYSMGSPRHLGHDLTYSLSDADMGQYLTIDPDTGAISVSEYGSGKLDYENGPNDFRVPIWVRDSRDSNYEPDTENDDMAHIRVLVTDEPEPTPAPTPEPPPAPTPEPTPAPTPEPPPTLAPTPTPEPTPMPPTGTAEKPGEPQNLSLAPGDGSLTATWDPPSDGGTASGYTVEYRPAGGGNQWARVMSNSAAASVEITGLEPGGYLVRVQAVNEIGASGWARQRTSKPTPPEPTEKPGEPRNLSVAIGADSLTATWDPPADGGAASGYNVDYRSAGGGNKDKWVSVLSNADVTSVEITGLEPDDYLVRVRAVNEIGESKRALKRVEVGP